MTMIDTNTGRPLTDAIVRNAIVPEGKAEIYLKEQGGLTVRVRASGARSFYFTHTRPGMKGSHKTFIGKVPALNVAAARREAKILAGQRAQGVDLIKAKSEKKRDAIKARKEERAVVTFGALIGDDNCPYAKTRRGEVKNWQFELGYLRRNLLADHRRTDIRELTRRDVMVAVNKLNDAGKRGAASAVWKYSYPFFAWCLEQGLVHINPLANARRRRKGSRAERLEREQKGRALSDHEIIKVWAASEKFALFGLLVLFCLLAGTRRGGFPPCQSAPRLSHSPARRLSSRHGCQTLARRRSCSAIFGRAIRSLIARL